MLALRELQTLFAASLHGGVPDAALRDAVVRDGLGARARLGVYRNSATSIAVAALALTYPTTVKLVGAEFFRAAAIRHWRRDPPREAWLAGWGADFARTLARCPGADAYPYLADVARLEWALHGAGIAEDVPPLAPSALAAVPPAQHAALCFVPHPSVTLLRLRAPADRIADAVLADDEAAMAAIELADSPVHVLVHRGAAGVAMERVSVGAFRVLRRLFAGLPLGAVLHAARGVDAASLLGQQLALGRLAGATIKEDVP